MLKPINYYEVKDGLYMIDEYGNIFSNYLMDYMKPKVGKNGYLEIGLSKGKKWNRKMVRIATLVACTFIGNPPIDMIDPTINHIDGDILNNHYNNLEWMERGKNSSIRKNTCKGELNGSCKLKEEEVIEICTLLEEGKYLLREIGEMYSVHESTISNIKRRVKWIHISCNYKF